MTQIRIQNLQSFNLDLERFASVVMPEQHLAFQKKIALDLLKDIVFRTPVGNPDLWKVPIAPAGYVGGRARGNWQVGLNATTENELSRIDSGGGSTVSDGSGTILSAMPFGVIWLFNNVPYIGALERGHSGQAPSGMVRLALAAVEAIAP